jgi:Holliday junction resolvasome RuvABC endonuclease subunit
MSVYIGFDISSTTIGYCIVEDDKLIDQGHIKPVRKKGMSMGERLSSTRKEIKNLLDLKKPNFIVIEDYAKKFSRGKSRIETIIVLSSFNEVVSMTCFEYNGLEPTKYPVSTIRKTLGLKRPVEKKDVLDKVVEIFPNFEVKLNKNSNIKVECFDESDAAAVLIHHLGIC